MFYDRSERLKRRKALMQNAQKPENDIETWIIPAIKYGMEYILTCAFCCPTGYRPHAQGRRQAGSAPIRETARLSVLFLRNVLQHLRAPDGLYRQFPDSSPSSLARPRPVSASRFANIVSAGQSHQRISSRRRMVCSSKRFFTTRQGLPTATA